MVNTDQFALHIGLFIFITLEICDLPWAKGGNHACRWLELI